MTTKSTQRSGLSTTHCMLTAERWCGAGSRTGPFVETALMESPQPQRSLPGGMYPETRRKLTGDGTQCRRRFGRGVPGGTGRGAVEEVSPEIPGIAGSQRRGGRLVRHGGRFLRRHLPVSGRVAGGCLGTAARLLDFSRGG